MLYNVGFLKKGSGHFFKIKHHVKVKNNSTDLVWGPAPTAHRLTCQHNVHVHRSQSLTQNLSSELRKYIIKFF